MLLEEMEAKQALAKQHEKNRSRLEARAIEHSRKIVEQTIVSSLV